MRGPKAWLMHRFIKRELKRLMEEKQMKNLFASKTVWSGLGLIIFALSGVLTNHMTVDQAMPIALNGLGLIGLKHAIEKK